MPEDYYPDDRLIQMARGYGHCIAALAGGDRDEWVEIDHNDFSDEAIGRLIDDCNEFLACADELHPDGEVGVNALRIFHSIGWFFGLARLNAGPGFELIIPGNFGRELTELAERFYKFEVGLSDDKKIFFAN